MPFVDAVASRALVDRQKVDAVFLGHHAYRVVQARDEVGA